MLIEKSFTDLEDAIYFFDNELQGVLYHHDLKDIEEAGIRFIPHTRRWQAYIGTKKGTDEV